MEKFDWHSGEITADTLIDSYYINTQNVRRFFKAACGDEFSFNRAFMQWMKNNVGKTMGEAAQHWKNQVSMTGRR